MSKLRKCIYFSIIGLALLSAALHVYLLSGKILITMSPLLRYPRMVQFQACYGAGIVAGRLWRMMGSGNYYNRAVQCGPPDSPVVSSLFAQSQKNVALSYYIHDQFTKSAELAESIILTFSLDPHGDRDHYLLLGMAALKSGLLMKATWVAEKVRSSSDNDLQIIVFLCRVALTKDPLLSWDDLSASWREQIGHDEAALMTIGDLFWNAHHYDEAERLYMQGVRDFPRSSGFLYRRGVSLQRLHGDFIAARQFFEKALDCDADYPGLQRAYWTVLMSGPPDRLRSDPGFFTDSFDRISLSQFRFNFLNIIMSPRRGISEDRS